MNSPSLQFIFLLFTVMLQQSCCFKNFDTHAYRMGRGQELPGSVACYRTLTLYFFEYSKILVHPSCIQKGQNEFRFKIKSRTSTFDSIIKYGRYHEQFVQEMQKAEELSTNVITRIRQCLADKCNDKKQGEIKHAIQFFKENRARCGDSSYLDSALTALENTCAQHEKKNDPNETKSDDVDSVREKGQTLT